ncbi:hypothetical protein M422DRAFT_181591, partial [Sphaerobolus stellatus SS14]
GFQAVRSQVQDALVLSQVFQKRSYNQGGLTREFEEGNLVMLDPHSLSLLKKVQGQGRKLLMKYDGPFEIIQKVSTVAYRL